MMLPGESFTKQGNIAFPLSGKGSDPDRSHTTVEIPPGTSYFNSNAQGSDCACTAHSVLLKQPYLSLGGFVVIWFGLGFCFKRELFSTKPLRKNRTHTVTRSPATPECCFKQEASPGDWEH